MTSYGYIDEKGADEPNPAYMHHCTTFELRNDTSSSDGLNGSIDLSETDLKAVGAEQGDPVKVYVEANDRWVSYERDTYSDRYGIGLPLKFRKKFGLDTENRTVEVWIDEAEISESEGEDEAKSSAKQVSLTGEEPEKQEYVLIPNDSPVTYHNVGSPGGHTTECGLEFTDREHRRFTDPGDALDQCSDCAIRSSDDMTNKELVEWLGEQAGFESDDGTPAYLSKDQLVALRDYILDLQDDQETDSEINTGSTRTSVVSET